MNIEVVEKAEKSSVIVDETMDCPDDTSVTSTGEKNSKKNWLGKEVKRPRAEYQAEINALKLKLAEVEAELQSKTTELKHFKDWVAMAPSAF